MVHTSKIILTLLLIGTLTLAFNTQPTKAEPRKITVPDDYPTIQEAINNSVSGDTIFVRSGTHYEHVVVNKSISLIGENKDTTIVDGNGTGTVIKISANDVNIINLTIRNAGRMWGPPPGIGYPESHILGISVTNILIENNTFLGAAVCVAFTQSSSFVNVSNNIVYNSTYIGILGYSSHHLTIHHNLLHDCGSEGIHLDGGSNNCRITNNTVKNCFDGISLEKPATASNLIEGNHLIGNNSSIGLFGSGANVFRRNNMTSSQYNLLIWGYDLTSFMQDIDSSNTVNNKTPYYLTNRHNLVIEPSNYPNLGYIAIVNCTNTIIRDFNITHNGDGLLLARSTNCTLTNIILDGNHGPLLYGGLMFFESTNNTIVNNRICNNSYGVCLYHSDWNLFYHNSFSQNDKQVVSDFLSPFQNKSSGYFSLNVWDYGHPSGGNFWSDYAGVDEKSGSSQNQSGSDGIGDTSYVIDAKNRDRYPLMKPWSPSYTEEPLITAIIITATIIVATLGTAVYVLKIRKKKTFRKNHLTVTALVRCLGRSGSSPLSTAM